MTAVYVSGNMAMIATDTRYTNAATGAGRDIGGRIRRVPGGWVTATGHGNAVLSAFVKLEKYGIRDPSQTERIFTEVHRHANEHYPWDGNTMLIAVRESAGGFTRQFVSSRNPEMNRVSDHSSRETVAHYIGAPGVPPDQNREYQEHYVRQFHAVRAIPDLVRIVGDAFRFGYERGRNVSDEMELVLSVWAPERGTISRLHLRKPLGWIKAATDREIEEVFGRPEQGILPLTTLRTDYEKFVTVNRNAAGTAASNAA